MPDGRYGFEFTANYGDTVYLIIENNDGALKLSAPTLFMKATYFSDYNRGFVEPLNTEFYQGEAINTLTALNESGDLISDNGESPSTGDDTILSIVYINITMLVACLLLWRKGKGGEQA